MTREQKAWLEKNANYSIVGQAGGHLDYTGSLTLMPNGKTRTRKRGEPIPEGAFDVAIAHPQGIAPKEAPAPAPAAFPSTVRTAPAPFSGAQIDPVSGNFKTP